MSYSSLQKCFSDSLRACLFKCQRSCLCVRTYSIILSNVFLLPKNFNRKSYCCWNVINARFPPFPKQTYASVVIVPFPVTSSFCLLLACKSLPRKRFPFCREWNNCWLNSYWNMHSIVVCVSSYSTFRWQKDVLCVDKLIPGDILGIHQRKTDALWSATALNLKAVIIVISLTNS